jgi:crotonobetainyl-CoA:carnitine CoA-transferase CaiB-like acyl-CoA transferase
MEIFERAEVPAAPVYDIDQFITDPQVVGREIPVDLPDDDLGHLPMHNVIPRLSGTQEGCAARPRHWVSTPPRFLPDLASTVKKSKAWRATA